MIDLIRQIMARIFVLLESLEKAEMGSFEIEIANRAGGPNIIFECSTRFKKDEGSKE